MPDQAWLDALNIMPAHTGTTEARLDGLSVMPTHAGTTEGRLDALNVFVVYVAGAPAAGALQGSGFESWDLQGAGFESPNRFVEKG